MRKCVQLFVQVDTVMYQLQHSECSVDGIIIAKIAIFKEDMTTHFAGEVGTCFFHLDFEVGMAGFVHDRFGTASFEFVIHHLGAFDFTNDSGVIHIHSIEQGHLITLDIVFMGQYSDTVCIPIIGKGDISLFFQKCFYIFQIFFHRGVGMMVGEGAVRIDIDSFCIELQCIKNCWKNDAGHTVSAIINDACFHPFEMRKIFNHIVVVFADSIDIRDFTIFFWREVHGCYFPSQCIDLFAEEWSLVNRDLETVVFTWIVGAGDHHGSGWVIGYW